MTRPARQDPFLYPPRGMDRAEAARYLGIGTTKFDELVSRAVLPKPKRIDGAVRWDRIALDLAFGDLPEDRPNAIDLARNRA
jgi:predicted DNA-binding transcriptional regulator AlpA